MRVITYQSPSGSTINITPGQSRLLERLGVWPRDSAGREFCSVSQGLHSGEPSHTTGDLLMRCERESEAAHG